MEDGKRHLRCSLCDTEWVYKRLACYNCGNEDHDTLSFLMVEEIPGYQIDVCEVCKSYLKVIEDRTGFYRDWDMVDVQTVYLDVIARQKGYSNDITSEKKYHS
jgi:FdhE protein